MSYIPEYHENYYRVEGTAYNQGKIGIGTVNPVQLLHVSGGNFRVDGTGYVNGDLNITGNLNVYGTAAQFATQQVIAEDKNIELNVLTGDPIGGSGLYTTLPLTNDADANDGGITLKSTTVDVARGVRDKVFLYRTTSPASGWVSNLRVSVSGNYGKDTLSLVDPADSINDRNIGLSISGANTADAVNLYRASGNALATDDLFAITVASGKVSLHLTNDTANQGLTIGNDANAVNLYKISGNALATDDVLATTVASGKVSLHLTNDTANQGLTIGNNATAVNLYKISGNALATDDVLATTVASGKVSLHLTNDNANQGLTIGNDANAVNLYKISGNALATDDVLATTVASGKVSLHLTNDTANQGLTIGNDANAVNLYKISGNALATDDVLATTVASGKVSLHLTNDTANQGLTIGNNATAVNLYKISGNALATDDVLATTVASGKVSLHLTNDNANQGLTIGNDANAVNLYKISGNALATDDVLATTVASGKVSLHLTNDTANQGLTIGSDGNAVNLYKSVSNTLKTDDSLVVDLNLNVNGNTTLGDANTDVTIIRGITKIADSSSTNAILFGSNDTSYDANIYRISGNVLATDDVLATTVASGKVSLHLTNDNANQGLTIGNDANAVNLYKISGNALATDDVLATTVASGKVSLHLTNDTANQGLTIGSDGNAVNLYKSVSNTLKTDDSLVVDLNLNVNGNTTLGDANTDVTIIRGITKIADSSSTNAILFGSNDTSYDANIYRISGNVLATDDVLATTVASGKVSLHLTNDNANQGLTIGNDANAVNLYKISGNALATDDVLATTVASGKVSLHLTNDTANQGLTIGSDGNAVNLYKSVSNTLKTDDSLVVDLNLNVNGNTTLGDANTDVTIIRGITKIADSSSTNGILFGSADASYDTNLYRSAANALKTDDSFIAGATSSSKDQITIPDTTAGAGLTIGADTNLYRSAANTLKTDDTFTTDSYVIKSISAAVAAAGTAQGTATALTKDINNVTTSTAGSAVGVILPTAIVGMDILIINNSPNTINIYPATSAIINVLGANNPLTLAAGSKSRIVATTTTQWYSI